MCLIFADFSDCEGAVAWCGQAMPVRHLVAAAQLVFGRSVTRLVRLLKSILFKSNLANSYNYEICTNEPHVNVNK